MQWICIRGNLSEDWLVCFKNPLLDPIKHLKNKNFLTYSTALFRSRFRKCDSRHIHQGMYFSTTLTP